MAPQISTVEACDTDSMVWPETNHLHLAAEQPKLCLVKLSADRSADLTLRHAFAAYNGYLRPLLTLASAAVAGHAGDGRTAPLTSETASSRPPPVAAAEW